jgi:hypothetical protein
MCTVSNACDAAPCPEFENALFEAYKGVIINSLPEVCDCEVGSDSNSGMLFYKSHGFILCELGYIFAFVHLIHFLKNENVCFVLRSGKNKCAQIMAETKVTISRYLPRRRF